VRTIVCFTEWLMMLGIGLGGILLVGCGSEPEPKAEGPSYAELVVTYNAELDSLDRLEKKKADLEQQLAAVGQPTEQDAMKLLGGLLGPAAQGGEQPAPNPATDPNAALDQAVQQAQATQDAARGMLDALSGQGQVDSEAAKQQEQTRAAIQAELDTLEQEITAQRARVERARQARDAAEEAQVQDAASAAN
jgi:septal ring factor EnvC (AmiA/AmiB activator)